MPICPVPSELGIPPVLVHGSPREADQFLVAALWGPTGNCLPLIEVMAWAAALHTRGEEFNSHVSACSYWLYEHAADFPELLRNWKREQHARTAARRSVVALQRQQELVGQLTRIGVDASRAKDVLDSMEQTCRAFAAQWEIRAEALDRLTRDLPSSSLPAKTVGRSRTDSDSDSR
ncbi:hypothetical protein [Paraburkholderia caribensis]|uniref:hypothetical protein n=1 Tax=Paraburkholderia caribensis TaxID=75105 RepID=UPI00209126C1|nr:hypothetical protein [Paraburkholderia caribensis]MCO4879031.1 hypothetical protein [Paraburkholderia caribensis]